MTIKILILAVYSFAAINLSQSSNNSSPTRITIIGTAIVIKHQAAVETDDSLLYYLESVDHWDAKYMGKRVRVTGKLVARKIYPPVKNQDTDNTITPQPRLQDGQLLRKAKWRLVK